MEALFTIKRLVPIMPTETKTPNAKNVKIKRTRHFLKGDRDQSLQKSGEKT